MEATETTPAPIDLKVHSVRDFLDVVHGVREAKPRDPLRALEDALLDLVAET